MAGKLQRRFWVLVGAAATAFLCQLLIPGTALDRTAFTGVARCFANPPFFISGHGSRNQPWTLRTFAAHNQADRKQAPVIVSLGDDREGFFQSSPPPPIDVAVILTNFQRLGAHKAATAAVLAWDTPDPIGLIALDKALSRFDSLVMAAPLSRGAVPEPMPPAFRKASLPLESVHGDRAALPVVNRIPLPGLILGKDNTLAGFQVLDAEPHGKFAPLLARWEDRVVFAFPLLTVLQRLDLPLGGLEIRLGEFLKLGPNGPIVPIDRYGRLAVPPKPVEPFATIPVEAMIDGGNELIPQPSPQPVVLRDDRSAAEPATRSFSQNLPTLIAALASDCGLTPARDYPRLPPGEELFALTLLALALAALSRLPAFARHLGFLTVAVACLALQCLAAGTAQLWLPGLSALAMFPTAVLLARFIPLPLPAPRPARTGPDHRPPLRTVIPTPPPTPEHPLRPVPPKLPPRNPRLTRTKKRRR